MTGTKRRGAAKGRRRLRCRGPQPPCRQLKRERRLHLNDPDGSIAAESRSENAGRFADGRADRSERAGQIVVGKAKVRMVEQVEELERQSKLPFFPVGNLRGLLRGEIRVPVAGSAEDVALPGNKIRLRA